MKETGVEEFDQLDDPLIVDVRSPSEYREDHLPGAINLPVLTDEERDQVGTIYHQESQFKARREGAKKICRNVPSIIDQIDERVTPKNPILIYCWRGGQRSRSLSIILDRIGYNVHRLRGGYKAYRHTIHSFLREGGWNRPIVTVFGLTGAGKTHLLQHLRQEGESVLNLERAANHRGSAFGGIGLDNQPTQKTFERRIYQQMKDAGAPIYTEGESRRIGRRKVPDSLFEAMVEPPRVWLETPLPKRVVRIRREYPWPECREELINGIGDLKERLGQEKVKELQDQLRNDKLNRAIRSLLVDYYDPAYRQSSHAPGDCDLQLHGENLKEATRKLMNQIDQYVNNQG